MTDIINLKRARKARARSEADAKAAEQRAAFGRSKVEKKRSKAETDAAGKRHEGHKRETNE